VDTAILFAMLNCVCTGFTDGKTQVISSIWGETLFLRQNTHCASHGTDVFAAS
jgi:hypothetical protein